MNDQTLSKTTPAFAVAVLVSLTLVSSAPVADATALESIAKACQPYESPLVAGRACVHPPVSPGSAWQQAMAAVAEAAGYAPTFDPGPALSLANGYSQFVLGCATSDEHRCLFGDAGRPCAPPWKYADCIAANAEECSAGTDPSCFFMPDGECDMVAEFAQCMADSMTGFAGFTAGYAVEVADTVVEQCSTNQFPTCPYAPRCVVGLGGACMNTETWVRVYDCPSQCHPRSASDCGGNQPSCFHGGGSVGAVNKVSPALVEIIVTFEQYVYYDECVIPVVLDNCYASGYKDQAIPGDQGCATAFSKMTAPNAPPDQYSRTCVGLF